MIGQLNRKISMKTKPILVEIGLLGINNRRMDKSFVGYYFSRLLFEKNGFVD